MYRSIPIRNLGSTCVIDKSACAFRSFKLFISHTPNTLLHSRRKSYIPRSSAADMSQPAVQTCRTGTESANTSCSFLYPITCQRFVSQLAQYVRYRILCGPVSQLRFNVISDNAETWNFIVLSIVNNCVVYLTFQFRCLSSHSYPYPILRRQFILFYSRPFPLSSANRPKFPCESRNSCLYLSPRTDSPAPHARTRHTSTHRYYLLWLILFCEVRDMEITCHFPNASRTISP